MTEHDPKHCAHCLSLQRAEMRAGGPFDGLLELMANPPPVELITPEEARRLLSEGIMAIWYHPEHMVDPDLWF